MNRSRRRFLLRAAAGGAGGAALWFLGREQAWRLGPEERVFIAKAGHYGVDFKKIIEAGFHELGVSRGEIAGRRILLKPNLVEPWSGRPQINTHASVVRGAAEAFLAWGAQRVWVGEAPGHRRDFWLVFEASGYAEGLAGVPVAPVDLNEGRLVTEKNCGGFTGFRKLTFSGLLREVDWVVSVAKMKTHHWAGVTLSLKNLFGALPGQVYGWPKNALHYAGIPNSIVDIAATLRPAFAIVDGVVGMEGDGPIMGDATQPGLVVMGRGLASVDATCARIMCINPLSVRHLKMAEGHLGGIREEKIQQAGESLLAVRHDFKLVAKIPAHAALKRHIPE